MNFLGKDLNTITRSPGLRILAWWDEENFPKGALWDMVTWRGDRYIGIRETILYMGELFFQDKEQFRFLGPRMLHNDGISYAVTRKWDCSYRL